MKCPHCQSEVNEDSQYCSNCGTRVSSAGGPSGSDTRTMRPSKLETLVGTTLAGKYHIEGEIGRGGMGVVYRAQDLKLKRPVALKFLPPDFGADPETRERFVIEAQAAAALSHPNICTIYEVGESDELSYIAMEFVEGQSLKQKIKQGPLKVEEATNIAVQVAGGLAEAHKKGVIHRDIKSANIMVTPKGHAKVMDFGLAKLQGGSSLTKTQTTLGTVAYMSPEQARGKGIDTRTDIWSLGVVLYEMMAGKLPFRGDHDQAVIHQIVHAEPDPLKKARPDISPGVEEIVGQALAKKPTDRYATMDEFREDLEAVAEGLKPLRAKRRRVRRILGIRTAYVYSAAVILLALILGLNIGGLRNRLLGRTAPPPAIRLAVLPFENLSGDPQQEYFSDGMTQELIAQLGRLHPETLSVIARTSVMRYKKANTPIDRIGRELNVGYVLEGSAQREGTRVRITAELIKVRDQSQLWSDSMEREMSGILALQNEVSQKVAGALALKLLPAEKARLSKTRTINPEAYDAYLKGSQLWPKMTKADVDLAQQYFELALAKDPKYALAYVGMAWVWIVRNQMGFVSPGEARPKSKAAARKALQLDASLGEAHYALACVTAQEWDWASAELEWRQTIELCPNLSDARGFYSHYLMSMNRPEEAMAQIQRALELDPISTLVKVLYAVDLLYVRRYDDAIEQTRMALRAEPENPPALSVLWSALALKGMEKEAFAAAKSYIKSLYANPKVEEAFDRGWTRAGYKGGMRQAAEALAAGFREAYATPFDIASLYLEAGDTDQALIWLEKGCEARDPSLGYLGDPSWDSLRSEPRFQNLLRRMGLPRDQKK